MHVSSRLRPVILLRGLPAGSGSLPQFQVDSGAGSARDEKKPAVDYVRAGDKRCQFAGTFTGATGLEPATSGVTGRVGYNDARRRTPLNVLICRRFSFRGRLRS